MEREGFIEMKVGGLTLDPVTKTPIVISERCREQAEPADLDGLMEATSMATELEGIKMARPMTHDLLHNMIKEVGGQVEAIEVTSLQDNTYYAAIRLKVGERDISVDSRPSDAISLALRTKCPIFVATQVLESSSVLQQMEDSEEEADLSSVSRDKWAEILEKMSPDDFKYKM